MAAMIGNLQANADLSVPNRTRYQTAPRPVDEGYRRAGGESQHGNDSGDLEEKRDYQRRWLAARRAEYFKDKACADCGGRDRLEIDHVDPEEKVSHRIWSWSAQRRSLELAKCRVRCRACHKRRHATEQRKPLVHGTANAYKKKGCRCDACRAWNATYKAALRLVAARAA